MLSTALVNHFHVTGVFIFYLSHAVDFVFHSTPPLYEMNTTGEHFYVE